jgi:ubiquitin-conjugating enzyme (huntingtin interacting protein 2)
MLLECPNPKDPQDAEVAKMMIEDPKRFALMAHEWAVKYAGAPRQDVDLTKYQNDVAAAPVKDDNARYVKHGDGENIANTR